MKSRRKGTKKNKRTRRRKGGNPLKRSNSAPSKTFNEEDEFPLPEELEFSDAKPKDPEKGILIPSDLKQIRIHTSTVL